jgi:hypothetical protein
MPGLVPDIHALLVAALEDVDGRDKPGHDGVVVEVAKTNATTLLPFAGTALATDATSLRGAIATKQSVPAVVPDKRSAIRDP